MSKIYISTINTISIYRIPHIYIPDSIGYAKFLTACRDLTRKSIHSSLRHVFCREERFVRLPGNLAHVRERRRRVNFRGGFSSVACDAILLCLRPQRPTLPLVSLFPSPFLLSTCRTPPFFPRPVAPAVTALVREGCPATLRLSGQAPAHACSHARTTDLILYFTFGKARE